MPRKVFHGVDFDEDDYDDYEDYDYDDDVQDNVTDEAPKPKQESNAPALWRCSICTYDNVEGMTTCDICGVVRNPTAGNYKRSNTGTVGSICKDSGVSIMAKSLFASLPHQKPPKAVIFQQQNDDFVTEGGKSLYKHRNFPGNFLEFHKAYSSYSKSCINIGVNNYRTGYELVEVIIHSPLTPYSFVLSFPFKFDAPSPDDLVSNRLVSSKLGSKANVQNSGPQKVSSGVTKSALSAVKREESSSMRMPKGKDGTRDESNCAVNGRISVQSSSKNSEHASSSVPKGRHHDMDESNSSLAGPLHAQSWEETSDLSSSLMPKGNSSSSAVSGRNLLSLASNLNGMSLSDKSKKLSDVNSGRVKSYQPEKWMIPDKAEDNLSQLNLAIVGHVDSGKSTLSGRLLHLLGRITQKEMRKYEKEAKIQGKGSFAYAWALDESPEERERGITMTVAVAYFDSKNYHVVVLDSPGHKDTVPNMISGATQADAAILVIDASTGAFEAGMESGKGQTREHAHLIRSFGVDQIIIAINKLDTVEYSKDRFDLIKMQLGTFLHSCGFKDSSVFWIPLSVIENQNLVTAPTDVRLSSWYHGPYLLDAIDSLQSPTRDFSKPLRMPICDLVKSSSQGQVSACGKLEAGALQSGLEVLVMPSREVGTVRSLERDSQPCAVARAGDSVAVSLAGIDVNLLMSGGVLCHPDFPVAVSRHLELRVLTLDLATPVLIGSHLEFHIHHAKEAARVVRIASLLDSKTGKVTKKAPRCLTSKQSAIIEVSLDSPVCVEEYSNCKALGRVFLRTLGSTIAVGIVTRIIEEQE